MKTDDQASRKTALFVDEIEDDSATLLLGEHSFAVPRALLPDDAREGDWLLFRVARTPPPDDSAARRERLGRHDPGGDIKL